MVPSRQSSVHIISAQSGAWARGTHALAWQHVAGTQSPSAVHGADAAADTPDDPSSAAADTGAPSPGVVPSAVSLPFEPPPHPVARIAKLATTAGTKPIIFVAAFIASSPLLALQYASPPREENTP
jgi:hypothetical protein